MHLRVLALPVSAFGIGGLTLNVISHLFALHKSLLVTGFFQVSELCLVFAVFYDAQHIPVALTTRAAILT
jgi:hypothetical protein